MPSSAFADLTGAPKIAKKCQPTTLDEAVTLISKKKLTKTEIDEQSLLHRAADAGRSIILRPVYKSHHHTDREKAVKR